MSKYRKKPVVIEAFRMGIDLRPDWFQNKVTSNDITTRIIDRTGESKNLFEGNRTYCLIKTLEGEMMVDYGDYIIKGIEGEIYSCKPEIFNKTYDIVYITKD
jgi:hypothetical protein